MLKANSYVIGNIIESLNERCPLAKPGQAEDFKNVDRMVLKPFQKDNDYVPKTKILLNSPKIFILKE